MKLGLGIWIWSSVCMGTGIDLGAWCTFLHQLEGERSLLVQIWFECVCMGSGIDVGAWCTLLH